MKTLAGRINVKGRRFLVMKRATGFPCIPGASQLYAGADDVHNICGIFNASNTFFGNPGHEQMLSVQQTVQVFVKPGVGGVDILAIQQGGGSLCL